MIEWKRTETPREFEVMLGHYRVRVAAASREDAIRLARRKLSRELPRMWDVIHSADEHRFVVQSQANVQG